MLLPLPGRNIYFDLIGAEDGPVVCFAHSLAADSGMWAEQAGPLLGAGFRMLRVDMRGHGGSGAPAGNYRIEHLAADVIAVADAVGIARFHYIGLSIGGMIGQILATKHRARLMSAMVCDTSPAAPADAQERWNPRMAQVQDADSLLPLAEATMARWLTERFKREKPTRWKQLYDSVLGTSPQGYIGCSSAIQNFNAIPDLPSVTTPMLVVFGGDDPGAGPEGNKQIARLVPHARCEEVAGALHFPNVEFPDAFNTLMLGWLKAHS